MRARLALLALLAPLGALAQLQLFVVDHGVERPAGAVLEIGTVAVGDSLDVSFRIRNTGTAPANLQTLTVSGAAFSVLNRPSLPFAVPAGSALNFVVRFRPAAFGSYSASLSFNSTATILRAATLATATVQLVQGAQPSTLYSGNTVDFGRVERGARALRHFKLLNLTTARLSITNLGVNGEAFDARDGIDAPVTLEPNASAEFDVEFAPPAAGPYDGTLVVDTRTFLLRGTGAEPPLPRPQILVDPPVLASSQQALLAIRFAAPSPTSGTGEVRIELRPATPNAADPAVLFLATGNRFANFTVNEGEAAARFDGQAQIRFQTGTTAGTLVFTAKLGEYTESFSMPVAPAVVGLDSARAVRSGSSLEIQITGFDNTRSLSQLSFTFYDRAGKPVEPGLMRVDTAASFRLYLEAAQKETGGAFLLRAVFPVTGGAAGDITAVDVELTNSAGSARPPRLQFP